MAKIIKAIIKIYGCLIVLGVIVSGFMFIKDFLNGIIDIPILFFLVFALLLGLWLATIEITTKKRTLDEEDKRKKIRKGLLLGMLISFILLLISIVFQNIYNIYENKQKEDIENKIEVVFDAKQFYREDGTTITEDDMINTYGEPQSIDEWNYEKADGRSYPIRTYIYGNYEYHFNNNYLQRISIYQDIEYTSKDNILDMFNLEKTFNSSVTDTNVAYRVSNCGIHDLWIWSMNDKVLNGVYISYSGIFSD